MKFWHEVSDEEAKNYGGAMTVGDFMKKYSQPEWCNYHEALNPMLGCWSLTDNSLRKKISLEFCKDCPECKPKKP